MGPAAEDVGDGPLSIEMILDTRSRNVTGLDPEDAGFQSMVEAMGRTYDENFWQVLYPGGDLRKWWDNRYDWWQEEAGDPERTERFFLDLLEAFGPLPDAMILESFDPVSNHIGCIKHSLVDIPAPGFHSKLENLIIIH